MACTNTLYIKRGGIIKLYKAVAVLTIFSVLTRILGFVFRIILSNAISTEMLGIYTIASSVFIVFATALSSGLPVTISKFTAENLVVKNKDKINSIITSGLIISLVMSAVALIIVAVTRGIFVLAFNSTTAYNLLLTMIPAILFTGVYTPFRGYLWGSEKYLEVSIVEFVEQIIRIVSCVILFAFLQSTNSLYSAGISLSIACVLSTLLGIVFFYTSKGKITKPNHEIKPLLKSSTPITAMRIAGSFMQPFIAFILPLRMVAGGFTQEQALSELGITLGMTLPLLLIPNTITGSLSMALIPKISSLVKENKHKEVIKQVNSAIIFTLCCGFLALPVFISLGPQIAKLIFNNEQAGIYLSRFSWLMIIMGLSNLTGSILNSLGLEIKTFKYYAFSSIFLFLGLWFLPKYIGVYALLYALGVSTLIVCILNIAKINKTIKDKNLYIVPLLKLVAICIPLTMLTEFTFNIVNLIFPTIVSLFLVSGISIAFLILLLMVAGLLDISIIRSVKISNKKQKLTTKNKKLA